MRRYQLIIEKANILRQRFIDGDYNGYRLAKELRVSTITTWRYKREFEKIRAEYPDKLNDFVFYPGEPQRAHWQTPKYFQFVLIMPVLLAEEKTTYYQTTSIWEKYKKVTTDAYTFRSFKGVFVKWVKENVTRIPAKLLDRIEPGDETTLRHWRLSNDHRHWQIAKTLALAVEGKTGKEIIDRVDTIYKTIGQWIAGYKAKGLRHSISGQIQEIKSRSEP
jgi:hypothetical protein